MIFADFIQEAQLKWEQTTDNKSLEGREAKENIY